MQEWFWLTLIFVGVSALCFLIVSRFSRASQRVQERLLPSDGDTSPGTIPERQFLGTMTPALAAVIPMSEGARSELHRDLRTAGYYGPTALLDFAALRATLVLVALIATEIMALIVPTGQVLYVIIGGLIAAALAFSLPRFFVTAQGRTRSREIERGLPVAIDLLIMCLSSGQNILFALHRVSRELRFAYPVLSEELEIVRQQAELRSTEHALQQLAERVMVPEVRNLALILVQSERLGTDSSAALQEFADNLRITMRQRAETKANRLSFWMLFPTILCFWIAAGIILVGPAYYEFWRGLTGPAEMVRKAQTDVQRANSQDQQIQGAKWRVNPPVNPPKNGNGAPN